MDKRDTPLNEGTAPAAVPADLPPLPAPQQTVEVWVPSFGTSYKRYNHECEPLEPHFTADQMRRYARAALATSAPQTGYSDWHNLNSAADAVLLVAKSSGWDADYCERLAARLRQLATSAPPPVEAREPSREQRLERALANMEARKNAAYEERNKVVAALAKLFPSGVARTAIEGWSEDWHGCVYIDLPTGQVSWHFHDSQAHLFAGLPEYTKPWDGHDTPEKYRRLVALAATHPKGQTEAGEGEQR